MTLHCPYRYPIAIRMCYFDRNALNTTGYSVDTSGVNIATIYADGQDDDVQIYMNIYSSSYQWIHAEKDSVVLSMGLRACLNKGQNCLTNLHKTTCHVTIHLTGSAAPS